MTSVSVFHYTQGPTPTQWTSLVSDGPVGAILQCTPSPTITETYSLTWTATGNGCPGQFSFIPDTDVISKTCIWEGSVYPAVTFSWDCRFTIGASGTSTIDASGNAQTITASPTTATVTRVAQQAAQLASIVARGADFPRVTSTASQNRALAKERQRRAVESEEKQVALLNKADSISREGSLCLNYSNPLIPRQCNAQCSGGICCDVACIGDGSGLGCCTGYVCTNFDPGAIYGFGSPGISYKYSFETVTAAVYRTDTTYGTVTVPSGIITSTLTSTQEVTITNVQTGGVYVTTGAGSVITMQPSSPMVTPIIGSVSFISTATSLAHSPIPSWTGSGDLLLGYCTTADYVLLTGPTVYWAPFIGCDPNKPDCCPFPVDAGPTNYPAPKTANQETLADCPSDYQTVSDGCCPNGYLLWSTQLGGQVPCFSALGSYTTAPPIPTALLTAVSAYTTGASPSQVPIQAIENIVYAVHYPVNPPSSSLSKDAQTGIGVGVGVGVPGLAILVLGIFFLLRGQRRKKTKSGAYSSSSSTVPDYVPEVPSPNTQPVPTGHYMAEMAAPRQGAEHYTRANASNDSPAVYQGGYMPLAGPHGPLGGYLAPQESSRYAPPPQAACQTGLPAQDQQWRATQELQASPPPPTASPPPPAGPRYDGAYSNPESQMGLPAGQASEMQAPYGSELHGAHLDRWELEGHDRR